MTRSLSLRARSASSRNFARGCQLLAAAAVMVCLGAIGAHAQTTWTVDTTADDSTTSTATAQTNCAGGNTNTCALRDAIISANSDSGDTIEFSVTGTITLGSSLPNISKSLTISGPDANLLTISGANAFTVFTIQTSGLTVSFEGLTVVNGSSTGSQGGAIEIDDPSTVTVSNCAFSGNYGGSNGGAIANFAYGTLTVIGSTFTGNSSGGGGAISSQGTLNVFNSTFIGNSAIGFNAVGGAIYGAAFKNLLVVNSTFSGNYASGFGGAIEAPTGTSTLNNNIFSGNVVPTDAAGGAAIYDGTVGNVVAASNNVYWNNLAAGVENDCEFCTSNSNAVSATSNPLNLPLAFYGGNTQTLLPQPGSAAICAGSTLLAVDQNSNPLTSDQRGLAMSPSYSQCPSGTVDAGSLQANYIQVQNNVDGSEGASACSDPNPANDTSCRLRDAIDLASLNGGDIDFASALPAPVVVDPVLGALTVTGTNVNIVGPGASQLTVRGFGFSSDPTNVFMINSGASALLYGMTIAGGYSSGDGGGVYNLGTLSILNSDVSSNIASVSGGGIYNDGELTIQGSAISGNSGAGITGNGGGIFNDTGGTLTVQDSTISGNTAPGNGGGIESTGVLTLSDSTVTDNMAQFSGGGVDVSGALNIAYSTFYNNQAGSGGGINSSAAATIASSTLVGNTATTAGGGIDLSSLTLTNSIVAGNSAPTDADIDGAPNGSSSYNLVGDGTSTGLTNGVNGNQVGATGSPLSPALSQFGSYGGSTQIFVPLPGSPVICAAAIPAGVTADQRGYPLQPTGGYCASGMVDIGAVKSNYTSVAFVQQPSAVAINSDISPAPTVEVLETNTLTNSTDAVGGIPVTVTPSGGTYAASPFTVSTSAGSPFLASFPSLASSTTAAGIFLSTSSIPVTGAYSLPTATSNTYDVIGTTSILTSPAPNSTFPGSKVTFTWVPEPTATGYTLRLGTTPGGYDIYGTGVITASSVTRTNLPTNGETIYVRLYTRFGSTLVYNDYTFTAATAAALISPAPNSTFGGPQTVFQWNAAPAASYYVFRLGTTGPGSNDLYGSGPITTTFVTRNNMPTNGETVYARLYTVFGPNVVYTDYVFTAATAAALTTPAPNSTLSGSKVTFQWTTAPGATGYIFRLGTTPGGYDIYGTGPITTTSFTRNRLPIDGETIYARLYTQYNSILVYTDYVYTAALETVTLEMPACPIVANIVSPIKTPFPLPTQDPPAEAVTIKGTIQVTDQSSSTIFLLQTDMAADQTSFSYARTVKTLQHATGDLTFDKRCTASDPYGSNTCDWDWGQQITAAYSGTLQEDVTSGKLIVDLKINNVTPLQFSCPICGGNCTLHVPVEIGNSPSNSVWDMLHSLIRFNLNWAGIVGNSRF